MTGKLTTTLLALLTFFVCGLSNEACAATPHEIKDIIVKTAVQMGVDPCIMLSLAKQESNFQSHRQNSSGAVGVFQLMPSTAKKIGVNPYNLNDNVRGGILYYQMMYKKFGSTDLALAAYNAGPGNVMKYKGVPPFKETQRFVSVIKTNAKQFETDPIVVKHTTASKGDGTSLTSADVPVPQNQSAIEKAEIKDELTPIIVPDVTL
ncbi:MAG: lytic transglycosylase domain-containing protein [Candidatus Gastranaerophilales bacterium]|nr:lytic transglycosylase domain-containing protein [Candidatus Gastranaerophilales bacterium]